MEGARQGQRVREGPVTGPLDRPSQQPLETRKAADHIRPARDIIRAARSTVISIHNAELQLLAASQRAQRQQAIRAIDADLASRHAGNVAAIVSRFANRRAALTQIADPAARAAAAQQLLAEEYAELARLALEHAAEKRRLRRSVLGTMAVAHRSIRRTARQRLRRQRIGVAVQLNRLSPASAEKRDPDARHHAHVSPLSRWCSLPN